MSPTDSVHHLPPRAGALDWSAHLPRLFTHTIGLLEVPVGTSSGPSPVTGSPTPRRALRLFMPLFMARNEASTAARTIVHLLKSSPARPHTAAAASSALSNLQHLVNLLEQYYHPSNTGEGEGGYCLGEPAGAVLPPQKHRLGGDRPGALRHPPTRALSLLMRAFYILFTLICSHFYVYIVHLPLPIGGARCV